MSSISNKYWLSIIALLLISLVCGGIVLAIKQTRHQPIEISLSTAAMPRHQRDIYIGGSVANPGFYPANEDDTIDALIRAAGLMPDADLNNIKIHVPNTSQSQPPQRISLNQAEVWLLQALPGIGQGKAQAIVDYRNQHGHFRRAEDLLKVAGIGNSTFDSIKGLITVED